MIPIAITKLSVYNKYKYSHPTTRHYMLIQAIIKMIVLHTLPSWLLSCPCYRSQCISFAKFRPNILRFKGKFLEDNFLFHPHNILTIQFIQFTYLLIKSPPLPLLANMPKYDALVPHLQQLYCKYPPITNPHG